MPTTKPLYLGHPQFEGFETIQTVGGPMGFNYSYNTQDVATKVTLRHLLTMTMGVAWDEERPYTDGVITGWGTVDGRKVSTLLLGVAVVALYDDREVWELLGYEGPSFDQGGYLNRGFDDLDWLPEPRITEYDGEPRTELRDVEEQR